MISANIDTKEIEVYKKQILEAEKYSTTLEVKTDLDYSVAMQEGISIKKKLAVIESRRDEITKPLNAALKSVRELFKPLEAAGESALAIIKQRMLTFTTEKERKNEEAKSKLDARVEKGTLKESTAGVKKFIIDQTVQKTVSTGTASATTRKVKKYFVTDLSIIPLEFILPDMIKIKAAFKSGYPVPGIEERLENELALNI